jgi:hypothetical protein
VPDKYYAGLNDFINNKCKQPLMRYYDDLPRVEDPEDFLQVNRYMELTQQSKPVITISLNEIYNTHTLVAKHLDALAPDKEDPLRQVMVDLGPPPAVIEDDDRDIQLTLTNRFKVEVEEESEIQKLYAETKGLVIPILRLVPIQNTIQRLNLMDILEYGIKHATDNNNRELSDKINRVLENLGRLEKEELVSKEDNYESFIYDVALEVANRSAIREQQRKEIIRLTNTLENLPSMRLLPLRRLMAIRLTLPKPSKNRSIPPQRKMSNRPTRSSTRRVSSSIAKCLLSTEARLPSPSPAPSLAFMKSRQKSQASESTPWNCALTIFWRNKPI